MEIEIRRVREAISDLLAIRFTDLGLDRREYNVVEGKTGKRRRIRLNNTALKVIERRRKGHPKHVHLFQYRSRVPFVRFSCLAINWPASMAFCRSPRLR